MVVVEFREDRRNLGAELVEVIDGTTNVKIGGNFTGGLEAGERVALPVGVTFRPGSEVGLRRSNSNGSGVVFLVGYLVDAK